jgi:prophage antirepressor-like protein
MEKIFKNKELAASVRTLTKSYGTVYFCAKDIATSMGYANTKNAIKRHVEDEYNVTAGDLVRGSSRAPLRGNGSATIYVTEPGVYELIFGSELKVAKEFRLWVLEDVLPKLRVTGKVELRKRFGKEIECASEAETKKEVRVEREVYIRSDLDLQIRVVNYIRRFYPSAIIFAGLGKLQDTVEKRNLSKCQGPTGHHHYEWKRKVLRLLYRNEITYRSREVTRRPLRTTGEDERRGVQDTFVERL